MSRKPRWKTLLEQMDALTKANGLNAWKTATILKELWANKAFKDEQGGDEQAKVELAEYSGRFSLGVDDMLTMIERFPNKDLWRSGRLDILRDDAAKAVLAERAEENAGKQGNGQPRFGPINRREYDKLKEENRKLKAEVRKLKKRNKELEAQLLVAAK